jgi:hypothetical protein
MTCTYRMFDSGETSDPLSKSPSPVASAMPGENEPAQVVLSIVVCRGDGHAKLERAGLHIHPFLQRLCCLVSFFLCVCKRV